MQQLNYKSYKTYILLQNYCFYITISLDQKKKEDKEAE